MSRVWEKVMEKMLKKAKDIKGIKKTVSTKAKLAALKYCYQDYQDCKSVIDKWPDEFKSSWSSWLLPLLSSAAGLLSRRPWW